VSWPARLSHPADLRFGSKADICTALDHVRFTPNSGLLQRTRQCLLWANSGHWLLFDHLVGAALRWRAKDIVLGRTKFYLKKFRPWNHLDSSAFRVRRKA